MSDAKTTIAPLDHLDFAEPCGARRDCTNAATWNWCCGHCDFTAPTCDECRDRLNQLVAAGVAAEVVCNRCHVDTMKEFRWIPR